MERCSVCETAFLDGAGAGGAVPRGSRNAAKLTYPALRFLSEERLRLVSPPRRDRRRYSGVNTRFSAGTAIRALLVVAVLRGNGQRS